MYNIFLATALKWIVVITPINNTIPPIPVDNEIVSDTAFDTFQKCQDDLLKEDKEGNAEIKKYYKLQCVVLGSDYRWL